MKDKRDFTNIILKNIKIKGTKEDSIENIQYMDNPYIVVPINHPNIKEIIKLLECEEKSREKKDEEKSREKKDEEKFEIITLNDITSKDKNNITISKKSIITPMAKDYIKKYKIKIKFN